MNSVTVRNSQIKTAEYMAQCGVDLIIGSHPHVMQRVGKIHTSAGREVTCFYSLGNLLSSMKELRENRESVIVNLILTRTESGVKSDISCIPTLCKDTSDGYTVSVLDGSLTQTEQVSEDLHKRYTRQGGRYTKIP